MAATVETEVSEGKKRRAKKAQADKAGKSAKGKDGAASDRRAGRLKRMAEANTVTFVMETEVRKYINGEAKAAGMDLAPFIQKLVENYVLDTAPSDLPLARRIAAKRAVLDRAVQAARELEEAGGFDEHFILNVVKKASSEKEFLDSYETAVDAKTANERQLARAQAPINQQMGRLIKRAAGARSKRDESGKILRGQVTGELISTYTLLEKA